MNPSAFFLYLISTCLLFISPAALSQELEEVVVTARKRAESLLDAPLAIATFGADELDRMGAGDLEDLALMSAGVQFQNQAVAIPGRYNSAVRFRGMATNLSQPSQQIGTVFVDGIWVSGSVFGIGFDDIERVEVIRGPQSAIFGRSTFGGAVNYITRTPGAEYQGRISAEVAEFGTYDASISHEGPIIEDKLFYRLAVRGYGTEGQYDSTDDGGELGRERTRTLAASLYATPTENFDLKARFNFSQDNDGPPDGMMLGGPLSRRGSGPSIYNCFANGGLNSATASRDFVCGQVPVFDADNLSSSNTDLDPGLADLLVFTAANAPDESAIPDKENVGMKRNTQRLSVQMNYTFDNGMRLTSNTGWNEIRANWIRDSDSTGFSNAWQRDPQVHKDVTQEFRLASSTEGRLSWMVGVNYFWSEYLTSGSGGAVAVDPNGELVGILKGPLAFNDAFAGESGEAVGVFGSLSYQFNDYFTLDFEGRYQRDEVGLATALNDFKETFNTFLPRAILRYQPFAGTTLYATYSEGNIPGVFNVVLAVRSQFEIDQIRAQCGCDVSVDEEELKNYEIGWKQELFGGRLFLSSAFYYMEWENQKNLQNVAFTRDDGTPFTQNVIGSVGETELYGVELEGQFRLGDHLLGLFSVNYAKSEYKRFNCAVGFIVIGNQDCSGRSSPRYPKWSSSFSVTYSHPLGKNDWAWFVRPDVIYQGRQFTDETNLAHISDYALVNLRAGVEKDKLRLEVFARNLFNDDNYRAGATRADFSGLNLLANLQNQAIFLTPPDKRTVGVKAVLEF